MTTCIYKPDMLLHYDMYLVLTLDTTPWWSTDQLFTARCTLVQSAVLRSHVVCLSVCLSVRDVGGSGPHRLEILETNCTDN